MRFEVQKIIDMDKEIQKDIWTLALRYQQQLNEVI